MMMKKILTVAAFLLLCFGALAQNSKEEFLSRYVMLVNKLGYDGVGVETLINKWEEAYPDDVEMLCAKFNYYFVKSQKHEVVAKSQEKFLGAAPLLSLKDSTGAKVNYFDEIMYDDDLYAKASSSLDRAIRLKENDASLRFSRINALLAYEKESPDMATQALNSLIDYNCISHPAWTWGNGTAFSDEDFVSQIIDCCFVLFKSGSPATMEAFRAVTEKMYSYYPKNTDVLNNLGSYYLVAKKDSKNALKYYGKTLKIDPDNYAAIKNCIILSRRDNNIKQEKKYLAKLIAVTPDETEKTASQVRLEALNKK